MAVIIGMLNYYSVISIDKFFTEVKYINMKSYYPFPSERRILVGEYGDEEGLKISKELTYHAKHKGVIKLKTYAFEDGKWIKELDVDLQL